MVVVESVGRVRGWLMVVVGKRNVEVRASHYESTCVRLAGMASMGRVRTRFVCYTSKGSNASTFCIRGVFF